MKVRVKYMAVLRGLSECPEKVIDFNGSTLAELVDFLRRAEPDPIRSRMFDEGSKMRADIIVFINDSDSMLTGGLASPLKEGDEVVFLPSVHGG
ncbi:MAG: MoaD/ThiS family protein [Candidatus Methanosuratincola petrocarbonis]|nr:MoaD/ThiS family protein [Candidatus Methanosuratincola sp.]